jgi:hypothetical protein
MESAANYLRLHTAAEAQFYWETSSGLTARLDPENVLCTQDAATQASRRLRRASARRYQVDPEPQFSPNAL